MMRLRLSFFIAFFITATVLGQKKPLDHTVYDAWQSIGEKLLTNNGKWVGYTITPQEGDNTLYLQTSDGQKTLKFDRGERLKFTGDSRFAIFLVKPFYKDIKAVKDKKLKKEKLTKDSLFIVNLSNGKTEKIPNIKSFKIPEKETSYIAYLIDNPKDKTPDSPEKKEEGPAPGPPGSDRNGSENDSSKPSELVVMNLIDNNKTNYENVTQYLFSEKGNSFAFITQKPEDKKKKMPEKEEKEEETEIKPEEPANEENTENTDPKDKDSQTDKSKPVKYTLQSVNWIKNFPGKPEKLEEYEGNFKQLAFDKEGNQLAFVGTSSAKNDLIKEYHLYYFSKDSKKNKTFSKTSTKMPESWVISENRTPEFSKNGKQLYFGIAPKPLVKDTALIANDHAVLDIWGYKDDELQPIQLKNLKRDQTKSYPAVYQTDSKNTSFIPLGNEDIERITLLNEGNATYVLASSNKDFLLESQWTGNAKNTYYIINNLTGETTPITQPLNGFAEASPLGKYVVYFNRENGNWYVYNIGEKSTKQLNQNVNVSFADEEFDMPDFPRPYGLAAWTDNDESVIIKDRYDLWEFFLKGNKKPRNITNGCGRKNKITFSTYNLDPEIKSISRNKEIYLNAFNEENKQDGIFRIKISASEDPKKIVMEDAWGYNRLLKAKNAEQYLFTKETYINSPDLYTTTDFQNQLKLSVTNPQQKNYLWGTDELVYWTTPKGHHSTGILYKPENFDPSKKYPMIVYFYEKLSDGLNRYVAPAPTPSRLNISYFVSNGYLVFTPDISYTDGHPGQSAIEYINSGVEALKKNSWVDGKHIGIQGQSWGGYQVAYLITQTDMYAAAWAGAPVVNMTSAYGGIRWSTGMNRQFQYEKSQSRIGKDLWSGKDLYFQNSPLFYLPNVKTPVVIMHNDNDGAVPWYQGIEMFTALKRLGKPSWLLNYNGDEHNLMKRQNRKDIQIREQQFFDHYLKGAKAPSWMTKGIPATKKGIDWGFDLTDEKP